MNKINIAIDGPAGAGKSTVARTAASQLQYVYIDTGAMYRALTWNAIHHNVDIQDEEGISVLLKKTDIELLPSPEGNRVFVDGEEVTSAIRSNDVTAAVSDVSAHAKVRRQMVKKQQELAQNRGAVLDGRDIGTTVLPHAELKVFLSASVEERARRRHLENVEKGISSDLQMMMKDIQARDEKDAGRDISPLVQADDAVKVDTTDLSAEEAAAEICEMARERIHEI
ncbi:(d)CMP kinase [Salibacterium qingdaonense]|uniref:Cytidylate kinase n=1 Tax=Salibacterium qingdaonense TaxID=266892 RepID=A0A1I4M4K6_9BACI|nr:(d)CMP kinase [Salibacterium qingdaonense]SFL98308.1 cytidylate kinase [Salibacterium qingdaonense]